MPWNPWLGAVMAIVIFLGSQLVSGLLLSVYPVLKGWSQSQAELWFDQSVYAKIAVFLINGAVLLLALRLFLKAQKAGFKTIGLRRPRWTDGFYSLAAFPIYLLTLAATVAAAKLVMPGLNLDQKQELGFDSVYHGPELWLIGASLVLLTPLIEEIIFRGLLYGSLKKALSVLTAAVTTSLLFAAGHLLESSTGLLFIAGIDTFVLSLVLIYLREKTGGLWAGIGLHALKNAIAFMAVFVLATT